MVCLLSYCAGLPLSVTLTGVCGSVDLTSPLTMSCKFNFEWHMLSLAKPIIIYTYWLKLRVLGGRFIMIEWQLGINCCCLQIIPGYESVVWFYLLEISVSFLVLIHKLCTVYIYNLYCVLLCEEWTINDIVLFTIWGFKPDKAPLWAVCRDAIRIAILADGNDARWRWWLITVVWGSKYHTMVSFIIKITQ